MLGDSGEQLCGISVVLPYRMMVGGTPDIDIVEVGNGLVVLFLISSDSEQFQAVVHCSIGLLALAKCLLFRSFRGFLERPDDEKENS